LPTRFIVSRKVLGFSGLTISGGGDVTEIDDKNPLARCVAGPWTRSKSTRTDLATSLAGDAAAVSAAPTRHAPTVETSNINHV
jgi:hypothetical protein